MKEESINPKLIDFDRFTKDLPSAIDSAKKKIIISVMIAYCDPETEPVFKAILRALKRGVAVSIYLDNYSRSLRTENIIERLKYGRKNTEYFTKFREHGAQVFWLSRVGLNPFAGRIHQKIYIIDDMVWVGGINLTFEREKNDLLVQFKSAEAVDWLTQKLECLVVGKPIDSTEYRLCKNTTLLFDPGTDKSPIYDELCRLVKNAKSVKISSRMCPSGPVMELLPKNTKYYFNLYRNMFPTTQLAIWLDTRKYGIRNSNTSKKYIHAKCALIDNKTAVVSSNNFNYRGVAWHTTEIGVVSSDKQFIQSVGHFFDSL